MFQIRIHGRGGQGVVTASELIAHAAFKQGRYAQSFPSFGSERTGAPVVAFARISGDPIRVREPVLTPDALIVQDATLLSAIDVFDGLHPQGYVLLNSTRSFADLGVADDVAGLPPGHAVTVPATELALEHLGRPLPNAVLLGALCAIYPKLTVDAVAESLAERFPGAVGEKNIAAARAAYEAALGQRAPQDDEADAAAKEPSRA